MTNGDDSLKLVNLRVTYKNAPIHVLEKFAFKDVNEANDLFLGNHKVKECVIVQTCNRVELFVAIQNQMPQEILQKWASVTDLSDSLVKFIEISEDNTAFRHLLSLTSGLDSLVVGEDQILGQVKRAFEFARHNKHAGSYLSLVFSHAIKTGTRIRNQTGLNKGSVSIGSIAVNLAEDYFDDLQDKNVLVIGTGESASLIAKSLTKRHVGFMVASRTYERAKSFAQTAGGKPIEFEAALTSFDNVDLIFVSTTAPYYLVTFDR
ncbi:MAG: glutamyl-tRNA reductase, partial [Nitrososphaeraceae archaeon]